jgi:hypothetical protein
MLCLLAAVIWRDRTKADAIWMGLALCLGMIIYVFETAPQFRSFEPHNLELAMVAISKGNNLLFWLLALALCSENFKFKAWHTLHIGLGLLPILFSALAIVTAIRSWPADLVERRRWLRGFIVIAGTLYMLGTGLARLLSSSGGYFETTLSMLDMMALGAVVFVIAWRLLILEGGDLFEKPSAPQLIQPIPAATNSPSRSTNEELALTAALEHAMLVDRVYREENLSIANLAGRLGA